MYGITIVFQNYSIFGPEDVIWVGMTKFTKMFADVRFQRVLYSSIVIRFAKLLAGLLLSGAPENSLKR